MSKQPIIGLTPPPVEMVRPGLWSIPVPIPHNPLGYTLVYAYETPRGPVLIDAGWATDATWDALVGGLGEAGLDVADCYGVAVTHFHPDHYSLSGRVRRASGAWIAIHPEDARFLTLAHEGAEDWRMTLAGMLLDAGCGEEDLAELPPAEAFRFRKPALPDRLLSDGDRLDIPGRDVAVVWTPGHSPGHCCFYDRDAELLFSGDHVLPRISPHVGTHDWGGASDDALGRFLESLAKIATLEVSEVLPAHEHRFTGLATRVADLQRHHEVRLQSIIDSLASGPASAWDIAVRMPWNRAWDTLGPFLKQIALSETMAHVVHLVQAGKVEPANEPAPLSFRLAAESLRET